MDSDTQPNPKPDWKINAFTFLVFAVLLGGLALFSKLTNPQTNVLSFFYIGFPLIAGLLWLSVVRLKVITILSLLASIVFLVISFLTKKHDPKLSSMSVLSAFFALAGAIVPTLFSRTQTFLYDRGFRGIGFYVSSQDGVTGGDWSNSGWGSSDSGNDCGGDGGGGGDCGG